MGISFHFFIRWMMTRERVLKSKNIEKSLYIPNIQALLTLVILFFILGGNQKIKVTVQSQPRKHFVFPQCGVSAK